MKRRAQFLDALKQAFAKLSEKERNDIGAQLGVTPVFNICFVKAENGKPKGSP